MATFTCYLPDELLRELDKQVGAGPDFNRGRGSRSGVIALALERYLGKPGSTKGEATVRDVFKEALAPQTQTVLPRGVSRADAFHRATQR